MLFRTTLGLSVAALACGFAGCTGGMTAPAYAVATGGSPERGKALVREYGCGACHMIPGIDGARGLVGPPLLLFARRTYIAGRLPNSDENLVRWLLGPEAVEPGTAMPDLDLTETEARDVAAYLYTLLDDSCVEGPLWP